MATATRATRRNGQATEAMDVTPPAGPREPREEEWHDLDGMPGFQVKLWANCPNSVWDTITGSGRTEEVRRTGLRRVVLEHNGWCDSEGNPYPPADAPDFYERISNRLLRRIMNTAREAMTTLPNFPTPTPRT